jgi:hypothetical protein
LGHPEVAAKIAPGIAQAATMIASGRVHIPVVNTSSVNGFWASIGPHLPLCLIIKIDFNLFYTILMFTVTGFTIQLIMLYQHASHADIATN